MKRNVPHLIGIALLVIIDQATKALVARYVPLFGSVSVIPGFFKIAPIRNKGAIFGIFSQARATGVTSLLTAAQLVAFGLVIYYFLKTPAAQKITKIGLTLILAGAVGNLIDRLSPAAMSLISSNGTSSSSIGRRSTSPIRASRSARWSSPRPSCSRRS